MFYYILGRAIQHDPLSRLMGDLALEKWEHELIKQNNLGNQQMILASQFSIIGGPAGDPWIWAYPQHCQPYNHQDPDSI